MSTSEQKPDVGCLKVSSKSSPASVAGAIAGMVKDGVSVEIQAVGAGAVNQAVKAIAISRGFLSPIGIEIACVPSFADIVIDGEYRTTTTASPARASGPTASWWTANAPSAAARSTMPTRKPTSSRPASTPTVCSSSTRRTPSSSSPVSYTHLKRPQGCLLSPDPAHSSVS